MKERSKDIDLCKGNYPQPKPVKQYYPYCMEMEGCRTHHYGVVKTGCLETRRKGIDALIP